MVLQVRLLSGSQRVIDKHKNRNMQYIVIPAGKKNSLYKSAWRTIEQAESEKKKLELLTRKAWTIVERP